jgi:hypothetical protein
MVKLNNILYKKPINIKCKVIGHSLLNVQPLYFSPYLSYYVCKRCGKLFYKIRQNNS